MFEEQYGAQENDAGLWKAFFRANAEYITCCNQCMDVHEQERLRRLGGPIAVTGAERVTRADDVSSDDDDDEVCT
jgi:hypothetical protein